MYFCSRLFDGLAFDHAGISPCCSVYGEPVPHMRFAGGRFPFEQYKTHILRVLKSLQTTPRLFCRMCPHGKLQTIDANEIAVDAAFIFTQILFFQHSFCNQKCVYCEHWKTPNKGYSVLKTLKSLDDQNAISSDCLIGWSGGEPSILTEFEDANTWLQQKKYRQLVQTNAIRFSPATASMLANGHGTTLISLDSASPETFYAVKGVKKFNQVVENIEKYVSSSMQKNAVTLKYIILPENSTTMEFLKFFELCARLGITQVRYSLNFHTVVEASPDMIRAAGKFLALAKQFSEIDCKPMYVPEHILKKITALAHAA